MALAQQATGPTGPSPSQAGPPRPTHTPPSNQNPSVPLIGRPTPSRSPLLPRLPPSAATRNTHTYASAQGEERPCSITSPRTPVPDANRRRRRPSRTPPGPSSPSHGARLKLRPRLVTDPMSSPVVTPPPPGDLAASTSSPSPTRPRPRRPCPPRAHFHDPATTSEVKRP